MKFVVTIDGDLNALMTAEARAGERAVSSSVRAAGERLKWDWRAQITGAGLGNRLANTIRSESYPRGRSSLNAAALVYSKAPQIIGAHDAGAVIRAASGLWLAIPLPAAGAGRGGGRWNPATWQFSKGKKLRFVRTRKGALLVADDYRVNSRGQGVRKRGKRRRDGMLTGAQTVPIFVLVPQVKLQKRLNLYPAAERIAAGLPSAIVASWRGDK